MIDPLPEQEKEPAVIISRSFRVENGKLWSCNLCSPGAVSQEFYLAGNGWLEGKTLPGKLQKLYGTAPFNA